MSGALPPELLPRARERAERQERAPVEVGPPSLATPLPAISLAVANGRAPVEVGPPSLATPLPAISLAVANGRAPVEVGPESRPGATYALLAALAVAFAAQTALLGTLNPSAGALYAIGGMQADALRAGGWERLFLAALLHGGPVHWLMNAYALWSISPFVERFLGRTWLFVVFTVGAVSGGLLGAFFHGPSVVSIGASGGITGVFAAGLLLTLPLPALARVANRGRLKALRGGLVRTLLFSFVPVLMKNSGIDGYAHLGGAIGGALVAFPLLLRRSPPPAALGVATAGACGIAFVLALAKCVFYTGFATP